MHVHALYNIIRHSSAVIHFVSFIVCGHAPLNTIDYPSQSNLTRKIELYGADHYRLASNLYVWNYML